MNDTYIEARVANEGPSTAVAYLLWAFLGIFGGHRFYLGRIGSAVALLILSAITMGLVGFVWIIIDAFLIPGICRKNRQKLRDSLRLEMLSAAHNSGGES